MGVEDAGTLAILLPLGTTISEIPSRLAALQTLRKERVEAIATLSTTQQFTEKDGGIVGRCECIYVFEKHLELTIF
jgi:hypothetical protein